MLDPEARRMESTWKARWIRVRSRKIRARYAPSAREMGSLYLKHGLVRREDSTLFTSISDSRQRKGVSSMDELVFDLTGVILQVLCLLAALCSLGVEAAALVLQVQSKDKPRSSQGDEPGPK